MNLVKQLKLSLTAMALPLLTIVSPGVSAAEPPANALMESYGCSYNPGKGEQDLMAARDYYVKRAKKAGVALGASYVWSLYKGNAPVDFVWLTPHSNLAAFVAAETAQADFNADILARFDDVAECSGNLGVISPVFQAEGSADASQPSLVSSMSCSTNHGIGATQVQDLRQHIGRVMGELDATPRLVWTTTPMTGGPMSPDIRLHSAHDSLASWADWSAAFYSSEAGSNLRRHFSMVLDCNQILWSGQQVIAPAD